MKKVCLWICILVVTVAIIFVGVGLVKTKTYNPSKPVATIEIEGYEKPIKIELDPQAAPNAVANFIKLANNGFYTNYKMKIDDGEIVSDKSMEKAHLSNIMEYPQSDYIYGIKGDFMSNGIDNKLKNQKGVIVMQRNNYNYFGYTEEGYNSANSEFSILTDSKDDYNGYYAGFGKIIDGEDVLNLIAESRVEEEEKEDENSEKETEETTNTSAENKEEEKNSEETEEEAEEDTNIIIIKSISVDTFGIDYGMPEYNNYETTYNSVNSLCNQYFGSDYDKLFK